MLFSHMNAPDFLFFWQMIPGPITHLIHHIQDNIRGSSTCNVISKYWNESNDFKTTAATPRHQTGICPSYSGVAPGLVSFSITVLVLDEASYINIRLLSNRVRFKSKLDRSRDLYNIGNAFLNNRKYTMTCQQSPGHFSPFSCWMEFSKLVSSINQRHLIYCKKSFCGIWTRYLSIGGSIIPCWELYETQWRKTFE